MKTKPACCLNQHYSLRAHVYACRTIDQVILLDARRGRYLGVSSAAASILEPRIDGWPRNVDPSPFAADTADQADAAEILSQMLDWQMLSEIGDGESAAEGRERIAPPECQLIDGQEPLESRIRPLHILHFLRAACAAAVLIRLRSIESLVVRMRRRRARAAVVARAHGRICVAFDCARARRAVSEFERLYQFAFSRVDRCLFRSVALQEYLSFRNLYPRMVFGVKSNPFAAHCWIQQDNLVINDEHFDVRRYTPILVI